MKNGKRDLESWNSLLGDDEGGFPGIALGNQPKKGRCVFVSQYHRQKGPFFARQFFGRRMEIRVSTTFNRS